MEIDIKNKIIEDFGNEASSAIDLLEHFEKRNTATPRVCRCILHLSEGNIEKLKSNIKAAETDWRDIIYWAEEKPFQFNKPFS